MKSREQFVESWRHQIGGLVADAYVHRDVDAGHLSIRMRQAFRTVDMILSQIYADFQPEPKPAPAPPANNGAAKTQGVPRA